MKLTHKILILFSFMTLIACGSSTTVMLKTKPSNASVVILNYNGQQKGKVKSDIDFKIKNNDDFFKEEKDKTNIILLITKKGYQSKVTSLNIIKKNEENDDKKIIKLNKLNTNLSIETNPPGANIYFINKDGKYINKFITKEGVEIKNIIDESLVKDHLKDIDQSITPSIRPKVITPFSQIYTEDTAKSDLIKISNMYIIKQGYNPVLEEISIIPGQSNVYSFHLKPFSRFRVIIIL